MQAIPLLMRCYSIAHFLLFYCSCSKMSNEIKYMPFTLEAVTQFIRKYLFCTFFILLFTTVAFRYFEKLKAQLIVAA